MSLNICQDLLPCLVDVVSNPGFTNIKPALHMTDILPSVELHHRHCPKTLATKETLQEQQIIKNSSYAKSHDNSYKGGWSFLQALNNNTSQGTRYVPKDEEIYVHPLMKRSSSMLSIKSLEMCTESLGCESGTIFYGSNNDNTLLSHPSEDSKEGSRLKKSSTMRKNVNHKNSFPPPITSMSGSKSVQVKPHREEGRLVLEAVTIDSYKSCFHAERSEGRLRLHILNDCFLDSEAHVQQEEEMDFADEDGKMECSVHNAEGGMLRKFPMPNRSSCKKGGHSKSMLIWEVAT